MNFWFQDAVKIKYSINNNEFGKEWLLIKNKLNDKCKDRRRKYKTINAPQIVNN